MNWKGFKSIVIILSISLAFPSIADAAAAAAAKRSSQKRTSNAAQSADWKSSSKGHSSLTSSSASVKHERNDRKQHQHFPDTEIKETPLIRLKRIKREAEKLSSHLEHSVNNNADYRKAPQAETVLKTPEKSLLVDTRQRILEGGRSDVSQNAYRDRNPIGSRIHSEMIRKMENSNRRGSTHGRSRVLKSATGKTNNITERIHNGAGHHRIPGHGSYMHHRNEQNRLESAAEAALRQRSHKKNKHMKGSGIKNYAVKSRPRLVGSISEGQIARGRGRNSEHSDIKGQINGETKHKARRGQKSEIVEEMTGNRGHTVTQKLEHIRRMQRDLMKKINQLEHMKNKKKKKMQRRSAPSFSSLSSTSRQNVRQLATRKRN